MVEVRLKRQFCGMLVSSLIAALICGLPDAVKSDTPPYATVFTPGTPAERTYLQKIAGATAGEGTRHADPGRFWVYGFAVAPGAQCRLDLTLDADTPALPSITVVGPGEKPLPVRLQRDAEGGVAALWTVPNDWPIGARLPVLISAKEGPVTVRLVRFVQREPDSRGDGLPDSVAALMTQGLPRGARLIVNRPPPQPYTVTQTPHPPEPAFDLQTDAVFAYTASSDAIARWKARGYTVWTMGGSRDDAKYAAQHPDEVQTQRDGTALAIGDSHYLSPTANRIAIERAFYQSALTGGSDGLCPEEPEYWARAGYEGAFRQAWQQKYGAPWQDPGGSLDARWKAGQLMASLQTDHIAALLQAGAQQKPAARRMIALHSPISYALWGIVCPQYRLLSLPGVQDVVGQVWTGTARTPVRYAGVRQDRTFAVAYLEYSSLTQLTRGTSKRLWFLMDPVEDNPDLPLADYKRHYEQTVIAALLFANVDAYEVMPWPERVYSRVPADYAVEINSVIAALQEMHAQNGVSGGPTSGEEIGVFVSDSMQWQRAEPGLSDFDGFFGLTLPLLQRGIPVQAASLDRASEPGYLNHFKTLLLSYDFQKPPDIRTQTALADWVRRGGSLLFFGGSDAYNAVQDSWWRQAKRDTPQADLWAQLGLPIGSAVIQVAPAPEDASRYSLLLKGDPKERTLANRRAYTLDLTPYAQQTGSVAVRFGDISPENGGGAWVASAELHIGKRLAAAFTAGSEIETRFLSVDNNSQFNGQARFADGNSSWTYRFDNLPRNTPITLTVDMGNGFAVSAGAAQPDPGHTLLGVPGTALARAIPRLRIGATYPVTLYPAAPAPPSSPPASASGEQDKGQVPPESAAPTQKHASANSHPVNGLSGAGTPLYSLRSGGTPIWAQTVGRGLVVNVGIAPGFFSTSERSAGLLRALVQYARQRTGSAYHEPGYLRLKRGRYTIVSTFGSPTMVEGRTIDLFSPTLAIANDRTLPPHTLAFLCHIGSLHEPPHLDFVSGRVQAKVETSAATVFFARGPLGTTGVARLHAGGNGLAGARASDRLGRPVAIQAIVEGETVLLRYPNDPDGVIVHAGWK